MCPDRRRFNDYSSDYFISKLHAAEAIEAQGQTVKQVSKSPPSWTYYNTTDFEYVCGLASLDPESVRREFLNCREYTPTEQPESWVEVFYE